MRANLTSAFVVLLSILLAGSFFLLPRPALIVGASSEGRIVPTGNTVEARFDHTATLLHNGKVLIAAGMARNGLIVPTAELYDPQTGKFSDAGKLGSQRGYGTTATLLVDGKVLLAGGGHFSGCDGSCSLASAELYDPATSSFSPAGNMNTSRAGANAILLQNGDVLIVGGDDISGGQHIATAELYHPSTRAFSTTGSMRSAGASALVLLKNGEVLALDGSGGELYNPSTGRFATAGKFTIARDKYGVGPLADGRLLIVGGQIGGAWGPRSPTTNIYDPTSGAFTPGPEMSLARFKLKKAVVPLGDGRVLIAGGAAEPEIYDSNTNSFHLVPGGRLDCFLFSTATRLANGNVLIVGGYAQPGGPAIDHAWVYRQ
jgi:Kelch motif